MLSAVWRSVAVKLLKMRKKVLIAQMEYERLFDTVIETGAALSNIAYPFVAWAFCA